MNKISEALDQYTGICKEAIVASSAKLGKSIEKVIIEVLLLYMVIPGKINFTQMGKYGRHGEQCYRQNFGRLCSKSLNWLRGLAVRPYLEFLTNYRKIMLTNSTTSEISTLPSSFTSARGLPL